jgi:hypothetical protein
MGVDMSAVENIKTLHPSEQLATQVLDTLIDQKLVLPEDRKFMAAIAAGKMKVEDWRMLIEKALDKEAK